MVPVIVFCVPLRVALVSVPETKSTFKVWSGSSTISLVRVTVTSWLLTPATRVNVPDDANPE